MSTFTQQFDAAAREAEEKAEKVFRGTSLAMFSSIVKRTPVDTGRLKGNWQAEINTIPQGDKESSNPVSDANQNIGGARLKDDIYLVNNLPYAETIENGRVGNKGSNQAPQGMVKITVAEFQREIEKQANKIR